MQKLRVLKTVNRTAGYFPVARYCISPTPGDTELRSCVLFQQTQKNHKLSGVEPLLNQGVLST